LAKYLSPLAFKGGEEKKEERRGGKGRRGIWGECDYLFRRLHFSVEEKGGKKKKEEGKKEGECELSKKINKTFKNRKGGKKKKRGGGGGWESLFCILYLRKKRGRREGEE